MRISRTTILGLVALFGITQLTSAQSGAKAPPPPGKLVKQLGVDAQKPAPLPIMGAYVRDRVSVADPSGEISALSILTPQKPERLNPAPFSPWNLPDPFEHANVIRLRQPWPESFDLPLLIQPPTRR
jgi:hypothetical protein